MKKVYTLTLIWPKDLTHDILGVYSSRKKAKKAIKKYLKKHRCWNNIDKEDFFIEPFYLDSEAGAIVWRYE